MVGVEDHHLGRAARLAAALDHAREGVETLHEAQRTGRAPAARKQSFFFAQRGQIRARARAPLEQHALGLGQIENGFERIAHRVDEARRALRPRIGRVDLFDLVGGFVVIPAVAARFLDAHVEPHRRVEARLLRQHQVRQLVAEAGGVLGRAEVALLGAPIGDGVDHAADQLAHAGLALRRADLPVKILADDDVGGGLRPVRRDLDVALLEDDRALVVADGGGAQLPGDFVIGVLPASIRAVK